MEDVNSNTNDVFEMDALPNSNKVSLHGILEGFFFFRKTSKSLTGKTSDWTFSVIPNSNFGRPNARDFALRVSYSGKEKIQMTMEFNFIFKNSSGTVIRSQKDIQECFGGSLTRCFKKQELPHVLLHIEIEVQKFKENDMTPTTSTGVPQKMLNLLNSRKHSDIIIGVEETDIPVHKCILANSSTVFEAMLVSGVSETVTERVEINNLTLVTVREMVKFMYSGLVEQPTVPLVLDLLRASDIYEMDDLQEWCHQYLKECLNWNNVLEVLLSAHDLNNSKLKDTCLSFLFRQQSDPTDGFQEELYDLAMELLTQTWT